MAQVDWRPGTPGSKQCARAQLAGTLREWLEQGGGPLTWEGGWRQGTPIGQGELWAVIVSLAVDAAAAVARFSQASRYPELCSAETVRRYAQDAQVLVWRLAVAVLLAVDQSIDVDQLLAAADGLVDEVDDEDDGLRHAGSAIAGLLQARLLCAEEQVELPASELAVAAVEILAPLLAQHACLLTRELPTE